MKHPFNAGVRLKVLRRRAGWSQSDLAKNAKLTPAMISLIECGHRDITMNVCIKVCKAFRISRAEFFEREETVEDDALFVIKHLTESNKSSVLALARYLYGIQQSD